MSLLSRHRTNADEPTLDPAALAELDQLDAALAGETIDDAALDAFIRDVRAAAPEMRPDATQHLNERVAARFGLPGASAGRARGVGRRRLVIAGSLVASSLLVTVALVGYLGSGSKSDSDVFLSDHVGASQQMSATAAGGARAPRLSSDQSLPSTASAESAAAGAAASDAAASKSADQAKPVERMSQSPTPQRDLSITSQVLGSTAPSRGLQDNLRTTGRAVERSVDLAIRVKNGELQSAAGKVAGITRQANGYVSTSNLSLGAHGAGSATFELRVDSSQLDRAIDQLSKLGSVTAQNESSQDITSTLDSAKQRLDDANGERKALLRALAKAKTAGEIAALRTRIAENRRLRAALDAQLQQVQRRADLTTIALTLTAPSKGDPTADDGSWSLGDAATDAWHALRAILGGLLVVVAVLAPFALLSAAGWAIYAARRRNARERALDE